MTKFLLAKQSKVNWDHLQPTTMEMWIPTMQHTLIETIRQHLTMQMHSNSAQNTCCHNHTQHLTNIHEKWTVHASKNTKWKQVQVKFNDCFFPHKIESTENNNDAMITSTIKFLCQALQSHSGSNIALKHNNTTKPASSCSC